MRNVGIDDVGVADPQLQGRLLLPVVLEAAHIDQFRGVAAITHEHPERAARVDGGELRPIAHEQHFRADLLGVAGDGVERERATERGFVDDDELPAREVPFPEAMLMQPLRRVLRTDLQIPGEDVGGSGRGCEPGHRALPVASLPGAAQGTHRRGLPGPCGADEDVEDAAGDADLRDRLLLIHRQGVPVAVLRSGGVLNPCQRHGRRRSIIRRGKEPVFCREHLLGGEHRSAFGSEHARPVRTAKPR